MSRIPDDVGEWLVAVRQSQSILLNNGERKTLEDMMNHTVFTAAVQNVLRRFHDKRESLVILDPISQASEILRIQGELRGVVAVFEALWETANADV